MSGLGWHSPGLFSLPGHRGLSSACSTLPAEMFGSQPSTTMRVPFYLIACVIITLTGAALLRVGRMQERWRLKVAETLMTPADGTKKTRWYRGVFKKAAGKYALFAVAFITVFREGIEGIVFIAGVSFSTSATSVPLPVFVGLVAGFVIGYVLYRFECLRPVYCVSSRIV